MLTLSKSVPHVGIDVDLAEDVVAAANQHHEFRFRECVTGKVIANRGDVRNVLVGLLGHSCPAHAGADGNAHVLGLATRVGFEDELAVAQHVGIDGCVGRAPGADAIAGHLQQCLPARVVQMCRSEGADHRFGCDHGFTLVAAARHRKRVKLTVPMTNPHEFALLFALTLDLFRDPTAKQEQKTQFRALAALLKAEAATIAAQDGRLIVNGTTLPMAETGTPEDSLLQRLEFHAVKAISIPADPPLSEMFELLRVLAEQPGDEDIATRLRAADATHISIEMQPFLIEATVPAMKSLPDVPPIVQEAESDARAFSPATAAARPSAELLAELLERPSGPHASDVLAVLGRQLETAMKTHRVAQSLAIIAGIVRAEEQVTDATRRRQYSIALKRMYSKPLLETIAELANAPGHRDDALLVLRRAGEDGVEVLLDLLVAAPTIEERRGIFMALTGMKEGTDQLVHMLGHHQWFVVRNVAELAGELGLDEAVPALAQQLDHDDERVRKAVALALAKIGSSAAAEPLRRALRDKSPEVRIQAALGVGGRKSSALAMPLVVAMEEEEDETVERELILALGRIGSPAAVQALIKFAQPGGRLFGRQPAGRRAIAIEALRLAATPAAVGTLEGLTEDGDKQVRVAAQGALADLKRK